MIAQPGRQFGRIQAPVASAQRGLFQVVVTPHHNAAHANHVHLEIDPARSVDGASSLWMR